MFACEDTVSFLLGHKSTTFHNGIQPIRDWSFHLHAFTLALIFMGSALMFLILACNAYSDISTCSLLAVYLLILLILAHDS